MDKALEAGVQIESNDKLPLKVDEDKTAGLNIWSALKTTANLINHILTIFITFYTWYVVFSRPVNNTSIHVLLTITGYQLMMAQTIMTFSGENIWSRFMDRNFKRSIHWALGATGSTLAVIGTAFMIQAKTSGHFNTPHGILGFVAMLCVLVTFINGPVTFFASKIKFTRPAYLKINHYFFGTCAFVLGMSSLILGFEKNWFKNRTSPEIVTAFIVLSSVTVFLTMRSALVHMFHVVKGLFRN